MWGQKAMGKVLGMSCSDKSLAFFINTFSGLDRYGKILGLSCDNANRTISARVLLKGETEPISVCIEEYEMIYETDSAQFLVKSAGADRQWVDVLLQDAAVGKSWPVPENAVGFLEGFLGQAGSFTHLDPI